MLCKALIDIIIAILYTYKILYIFSIARTQTTKLKGDTRLKQWLHNKEDMWVENEHIKSCCTPMIIRERNPRQKFDTIACRLKRERERQTNRHRERDWWSETEKEKLTEKYRERERKWETWETERLKERDWEKERDRGTHREEELFIILYCDHRRVAEVCKIPQKGSWGIVIKGVGLETGCLVIVEI